MKQFSDEELVRKYRETQDQRYLGEFYDRYYRMLVGTSFKYLKDEDAAEDAASDIYLELQQKLLTFEITHPKSWLYRLTVNHCLQKTRKKKKNPEDPLDEEIFDEGNVEFGLMEHLTDEFSEEQLRKCLDGLDESQKVAVEMFFLREQSYKQIETQMEWTYNKVKSYIQNGIRNLRNCFGGKGKGKNI